LIHEINEEILGLLKDFDKLPVGSLAQETLYNEIEKRYDKIAELKKPHMFERPTGQRIALVVSFALIGFGWLFHVGGVLTFGVFALLVTVLGVMKAPVERDDEKA